MFEIVRNILPSFACTSHQLKLLLLKMADRLGAAICILLELESPDKVYHQKRRILPKILLYLYLCILKDFAVRKFRGKIRKIRESYTLI